MTKQFNNELITSKSVEQIETTNTNLDNLLTKAKEEPLIFSMTEASSLVENVMLNDVTSSVIKNTLIIGGSVLLSAVFGWMYYEVNRESTINQEANRVAISNNNFAVNEKNKIKLSSAPNAFSANTNEKQFTDNTANTTTTASNNNLLNAASNKSKKPVENNIANTSSKTAKKSDALSEKQIVKPVAAAAIKQNEHFSKTIITQRYFDDGSAKITLEYKNQPARITINARGIESLFINSEEVDPSYYYLYEDLAIEAFRRSKIEPLAGPIHDANAKPNINAMMTGALTRRGLIQEGELFNFELTPSIAILNNVTLKADMQKDLLQVYQSAFGSSLPRGGKFIIGKKQ